MSWKWQRTFVEQLAAHGHLDDVLSPGEGDLDELAEAGFTVNGQTAR